MKTYQMSKDEIELLSQVMNFGSYKKLSEFFNRPQLTIKQHIYKLNKGHFKYIYL